MKTFLLWIVFRPGNAISFATVLGRTAWGSLKSVSLPKTLLMTVSELTNLLAVVQQNPALWISLTVGIGFLIWLSRLYWRRKLSKWAESQGMKLVRFRGAWFFEGPSKFVRSRNQHLFRVIVEDHSGITHSAWIMFGTFWGFTWGIPLTDVEWDNETDY